MENQWRKLGMGDNNIWAEMKKAMDKQFCPSNYRKIIHRTFVDEISIDE